MHIALSFLVHPWISREVGKIGISNGTFVPDSTIILWNCVGAVLNLWKQTNDIIERADAPAFSWHRINPRGHTFPPCKLICQVHTDRLPNAFIGFTFNTDFRFLHFLYVSYLGFRLLPNRRVFITLMIIRQDWLTALFVHLGRACLSYCVWCSPTWLVHQKRMRMNKQKPMQKGLRAENLALCYEATCCHSETVRDSSPKTEYRVWIKSVCYVIASRKAMKDLNNTSSIACNICTDTVPALSHIIESGYCIFFLAELAFDLRDCTDHHTFMSRCWWVHARMWMQRQSTAMHQHSQILLPCHLWIVLFMLVLSISPNSCNGAWPNTHLQR